MREIEMTHEVREIGRCAYGAYAEKTGGKSLATGDPLPEWDFLPLPIREAWAASAVAVATRMKARAVDAFYGYVELY